jgi:valyl-tRNA synthetase
MKLPKAYTPAQYENDIYALWEKSGAFTPSGDGQAYSIVVPPPNANGDLHIGHAMTLALEDIAIRYHRLKGERTLFVPGADHAGFETWVVYEKKLAKEGKSRFDFTREELYKQVWDFVTLNREHFEQQLRQLGASVDWAHFTFTLDDKIVKRAYATFKKMWDEGLIYRGERLVNFCTFHGTSFADIEVAYKEEKGKLWYIRYPLSDGSGEIVVATTRPETMLGDTGVAVHPDDARYRAYVGKTVRLPLTGRDVPIIADNFVDKDYGTGAVKLTPAHDATDFEAGKRHNLPMITIIDHEGKITANAPEAYRGLTVLKARDQIVKDLAGKGILVKTETLTHSVGHCYKCDTVIEPLLGEQWFVDMQPLAKPAIEALKAGKITFYPEAKKDQLITYLEGLRDWNISRQIAWGIPIPAFQNVDDPDDWIYDERVGEETITLKDKTYHRDPDVFDTWFSSSSWPYATLDYPDSQDAKDFYPLDLMETGGEILYPWVSRMIMLGLYVTGGVPFKTVYIHGYVMAEDGAKMSKSLGNVINPQAVITTYGSDALRMGIIAGRAPAVNRGYDPRNVEEARNFCNKLWNIARFIEDSVGDDFKRVPKPVAKSMVDHWILNKLQRSTEAITAHLDNYRFAEAYDTLYHFVWNDFADWYVEASKVKLNVEILSSVLEATLKLAHPFAPFVTETIWQTLAWEADSLLISGRWPEIQASVASLAHEFEEIKTIISEVRFITTNLKLRDTTLHYIAPDFVKANVVLIEKLARVTTVTEVQMRPGLRLTATPYQCWLDVDGKVLTSYMREVDAKITAQQQVITQLEQRLKSPDYVAKAPPALVEQTKQQLLTAQTTLATLTQEVERFRPQQLTKPEATLASAKSDESPKPPAGRASPAPPGQQPPVPPAQPPQ